MKKLFSIFLILVAYLYFTFPINAADAILKCGNNGCDLSPNSQIFSESNIYPNWSKTYKIEVTNNYNETRVFAIDITKNNFKNNDFSDVLTFKVNHNSNSLYGPVTFLNFKNDGFIEIDSIGSGNTKTFDFIFYMKNVGNEYQGKEVSFDLDMGFELLNESSISHSNSDNESVLGTNFSNTFSNIKEQVGEVLGTTNKNKEATEPEKNKLSNNKTENKGDILGLKECKNNILWILILLIQLIISLLSIFYRNLRTKLMSLISGFITVPVIYTITCSLWFPFVTAVTALIVVFIPNKK